jgi:hypothetical protein
VVAGYLGSLGVGMPEREFHVVSVYAGKTFHIENKLYFLLGRSLLLWT